MTEKELCLCWVEDRESPCSHKRHRGFLITCESKEIWSKCVEKEEPSNFRSNKNEK